MDTVRLPCAALLTMALLGCGTTDARRAAEAVCDGHNGGPEHCPGAPCLGCHGSEFVLAGTIYANPTDATGLAGAVVTFTDADGASYTAATNLAGNFMVLLTNDPAMVRADTDGRSYVTTAPLFPIASVSVQDASDPTNPLARVTMASPIHRDGSCATCHQLADTPTSATGPGRVYAIQPVLP